MSPSVAYMVLFAALTLTFILSFGYMVQKRGLISGLLWSFIPFRWLLSRGSDTPFDDNPGWLDRLQMGLIVALGLLWLAGRAKLIP